MLLVALGGRCHKVRNRTAEIRCPHSCGRQAGPRCCRQLHLCTVLAAVERNIASSLVLASLPERHCQVHTWPAISGKQRAVPWTFFSLTNLGIWETDF